MQSTICNHRDDGRSGGHFTSYEVVKVTFYVACGELIGEQEWLVMLHDQPRMSPLFDNYLLKPNVSLSPISLGMGEGANVNVCINCNCEVRHWIRYLLQ